MNHRKCQFCRLEKCFEMGMRKDFLLSNDEKEKRRQRLKLKSKINSFEEENNLLNDKSLIQIDNRNNENVYQLIDKNSYDDIDQVNF